MIVRSLAGLLAVLFLSDPGAGTSAWLQIRKAIVKDQVRRHILSSPDRTGLVLLEFTKTETESLLRWEHAREFEFDGQMYDIVDSWSEGETVFYRCFWDRAETRLNQLLRAIALRSFGAAPKFGADEGFGPGTQGTRAFLVARAWPLRDPWLLFPPSLRSDAPGCSSRSLRPPTPPPWTA
jgi:hypothetical protein